MSQTRIHNVPSALVREGAGWHVIRTDTGAKVAEAATRFLAIARAAIVLHTPQRRTA